MKVLLKLILLLVLVVYLVLAFTRFTRGGDGTVCTVVKVAVADSLDAGFITQDEVREILQRNRLYPVGRPMDSVSGKEIEDVLDRNPFIKESTCYKAPGGRVHILVTQRMPVVRVLSDNGDDYYIDEEGQPMRPAGYEANLVVATGRIDKAATRKSLVRLGRILQEDEFWNDQIEQINVTPEGNFELVPRVGDHLIGIGKPERLTQKLRNLRTFYERVLPTVGWNKYSRINLEFENQVVCKKAKRA